MANETFTVQNVKCGGCASAIKDGIGAMPGIDSVEVEVDGGMVTVTGTNLDRSTLSAKLAELGYPVA